MKRFFLTTAIDYVNSRPHLGTAYEKVCADVIARYQRLCGFETRFLINDLAVKTKRPWVYGACIGATGGAACPASVTVNSWRSDGGLKQCSSSHI